MQKFLESQDFKDMNVGFGLDEGSFQSKRILINLIFFFLSIFDSLNGGRVYVLTFFIN